MRTRLLLRLAALGLLAGRAPAQSPPIPRATARQPSTGAATSTTAGGERRVRVGGADRRYVVRAPRGLTRADSARPVVVMFHGGGGNAANAERMAGWTDLVEREGLIVVYPDGTGRNGRTLLTWNAVHCCGQAMRRSADDVAFVDAMLDALAREFPVDPRRIYLTGMSNGGMITHRMGRALRHRPAAIAPVVGALFGDEPMPAGPVPAFIVNGLRDTNVPPQGGLGDGVNSAWDGTPPRPNLAQSAYWARANGCEPSPRLEETDRLLTWRYACPAGLEVVLTQVKRGGHAWFGGHAGRRFADAPNDDLDATEAIWTFFKAHVRP